MFGRIKFSCEIEYRNFNQDFKVFSKSECKNWLNEKIQDINNNSYYDF